MKPLWDGPERRACMKRDSGSERRACMMGDSKVLQLKKISDALPDLTGMLISKSDGMAQYRVSKQNGSDSIASSIALLSEPDVGVMRYVMKKGDSFMTHQHPEDEWVIVVSGSFETTMGGVESVVSRGQCVHYPPGIEHRGIVTEDLDCICISIPKALGYA